MKLEIYMKSGNVIHLKGIESCDIRYNSNTITSLTLTTKSGFLKPSRALFVPSIDLSQIEAIVRDM